MRKLSRIAVKDIQILSAEEMAQIEGGEFLIDGSKCTTKNEGTGCFVATEAGVYTGRCSIFYVTIPGTKYDIIERHPFCQED